MRTTAPAVVRVAALLLHATTAYADPPCITEFVTAEAVAIEGNAVRFCDDQAGKKQKCFAVDLTTGVASSVPIPKATKSPSSLELQIDGKTAKVCAGGKCKALKPKAHVDEGLGMHGTVRGKLAVLINLDRVETFDVATGKRLAGFDAGKGLCADVTILSDTMLLVHDEECGNDGTMPEESWFATPKGKRVAKVGIKAGTPAIGGTTAAFVARDGSELVVHDTTTGKQSSRTALSAGPGAAIAVDGQRVVVVAGGKQAGDVTVIGKPTLAAKRCP